MRATSERNLYCVGLHSFLLRYNAFGQINLKKFVSGIYSDV
jgi:hypothetical protein